MNEPTGASIKTKRKTWIKFYPEKWLFGTTREEMTNSERAVWWDLLALAAMNDPLGQVDFTSYKRLANMLNISTRLLKSTIQKALLYEKVKLEETQIESNLNPVGSNLNKKNKKNSSTCDQLVSKCVTFDPNQSKIGLVLRTIKILKWNEYQSEYMRQKPHREKLKEANKEKPKKDKKLQKSEPKTVTQVTDRGEERRGEKKREEERREKTPNKESSNSPLPSTPKKDISMKEEFLAILKSCNNYPFDELKDSILFDTTISEYPEINILKQAKRKVDWWKARPDALKANSRKQLQDFFKGEDEFQKRGGPQRLGEIIRGLDDPDHRNWLKKF